jgi:DNA-binding beta-propeller fold protein YncE
MSAGGSPRAESDRGPCARPRTGHARTWHASIGPMRALAVVGLIGVAMLLAACGGSSPHVPTRSAAATSGTPSCPSRATAAPSLTRVRTQMMALPGAPYAIVSTERWSFVSTAGEVDVLRNGRFAPRLVRRMRLPAASGGGRHGMALTHDGRYLLVSGGSGAVVIGVNRAERGTRRPVLGMLTSAVQGSPALAGSIAVVISPDDRFAYVARARASGVAVFDLASALADRLRTSGYIGRVPLTYGPSALALGPRGRWLYATRLASPNGAAAGSRAAGAQDGTLTMIDAIRARTRPDSAVVRTVAAGCEPVRVTVSAAGRLVWVTALASHAVLGYSSSRILHRVPRPMIAYVPVGSAPVGVLPIDGGRRLLVADSGAAGTPAPGPGVTVVDVAAAVAGRPAAIGTVPAGVYPRDLAVPPGRRTAFVTNYGSDQIEAVNLNTVP